MQYLFRFGGIFIFISLLVACQEAQVAFMPASATATATATITPTFTPSPTPTPDPAYEGGLRLVARVNGQPIFLSRYQAQLKAITDHMARHGTVITPPQAITQQVLSGLITQSLLIQQAQTLALTVTNEALQQYLEEITPTQLRAWQSRNDVLTHEFTDTLRFQLLVNQLFERITAADSVESRPQKFSDWLSTQRDSAKIEFYPITP